MSLGLIPPVSKPLSDVPTEQTKKEMADYTLAQRNIHLYERTIADLMKSRDDFKSRVISLEGRMDADLPFAIKLEELKGRHSESVTQHCVTTLMGGA
ncbi:MAG: hypothetical protein H7Y36_12340 [Armatimonadetes bacterium]|nr:hypothetical protein [Akkermansiaceae bacterium]